MQTKTPKEMRYQQVVKANELITNGRFNLSVPQQRILLYLISQIMPSDEGFKYYDFSIPDFCRVCGIEADSGKNYSDLKKAILDLQNQQRWVSIGDEEVTVSWIGKTRINKKDGYIKIRLDEDLRPYLLQLKNHFTHYELIWTLKFKSKYSFRLYDIVKMIHFHELEIYRKKFELDELQRMMGAEIYKTYQAFKERALIPAINDINEFSDKRVEYVPIKHGRSVAGIELVVSSKDTYERVKLQLEINNQLDGVIPNQIGIEGF